MPLQMLPGIATVGRAIETAPFAAAGEKPWLPPHLVERGKKCVGIMRIENDIDRAGVLILAQHLLPGRATIGRAIDSALLVRPKSVSDRGDENDVWIFRVNDDRSDMAAVLQTDMAPVSSSIDRLINAVAVGDVSAQGRFARADIDDIVIARCDRDRADRRGRMLLVEHRLPVRAAIARFPHAASYTAKVIGVGLARDALDRDRASAAERPDLTPLHAAPELRVEMWLGFRFRLGRRRTRSRHRCPRPGRAGRRASGWASSDASSLAWLRR